MQSVSACWRDGFNSIVYLLAVVSCFYQRTTMSVDGCCTTPQNLLFLFAFFYVFVLRFVSAGMDEFFAPHGALLN